MREHELEWHVLATLFKKTIVSDCSVRLISLHLCASVCCCVRSIHVCSPPSRHSTDRGTEPATTMAAPAPPEQHIPLQGDDRDGVDVSDHNSPQTSLAGSVPDVVDSDAVLRAQKSRVELKAMVEELEAQRAEVAKELTGRKAKLLRRYGVDDELDLMIKLNEAGQEGDRQGVLRGASGAAGRQDGAGLRQLAAGLRQHAAGRTQEAADPRDGGTGTACMFPVHVCAWRTP